MCVDPKWWSVTEQNKTAESACHYFLMYVSTESSEILHFFFLLESESSENILGRLRLNMQS